MKGCCACTLMHASPSTLPTSCTHPTPFPSHTPRIPPPRSALLAALDAPGGLRALWAVVAEASADTRAGFGLQAEDGAGADPPFSLILCQDDTHDGEEVWGLCVCLRARASRRLRGRACAQCVGEVFV